MIGGSVGYLASGEMHNENINDYTKGKGPWRLVFVQQFETRSEALKQEKKLKRCNKDYLRWLIDQPLNILNKIKMDR
jgi:putative endonuclease